jgi:hypothetical protein
LVDALQWVLIGVLILVFLWFWPQGIVPERRRRFTREGVQEGGLAWSRRIGRPR